MIHLPSRRQGTQVLFLGWEDPLEEEMATHSSILAWKITHGQRRLEGYSPWHHKELDLVTKQQQQPHPEHRNIF